jgi:hypothetical protein
MNAPATAAEDVFRKSRRVESCMVLLLSILRHSL